MTQDQTLWEKGDFTRIANLMRASGESLARSLGVARGTRVLDLGCGDGTTAVPLARLGAEVTGIDIARNLVEAGRRRAELEGLRGIRFETGDACQLEGVASASFDVTLSVFGAMFASRPLDAAREMVRVTRPGGRIVMGNWIPNDPTSFVSQLLRICSSHLPPPPPGLVSPMAWGIEATVAERFGEVGVTRDRISFQRDTFRFEAPGQGPAEIIELFRRYYGPTMNAFEAAGRSGKAVELEAQLLELARAQSQSANGVTSIAATYLRVEVLN